MREFILKADGQEITVYAEESELAKLTKPERARTGYERVDNEETYYAHGFYPSPIRRESNDERDEIHFSRGDYVNDKNLFYDRERADKLHDQLEQWQALNDEPVDWDNSIFYKYKITFDYSRMLLFADNNTSYRDANVVYFSSKEKAQEAIKVFRDELMWYYTEYRSRLDEPRKGEDE